MRFAVLLAMAAAGCSDSLYTALFDARGADPVANWQRWPIAAAIPF
jgi:hypothetical protein